MHPELKARWIADLRENADLQGRGRLVSIAEGWSTKYCCLGRACVLFRDEAQLFTTGRDEFEGQQHYMPNKLAKFLGLDEHPANDCTEVPLPFYGRNTDYSSVIGEDCEIATLARCNDWGCTFPQIADLIEYFL